MASDDPRNTALDATTAAVSLSPVPASDVVSGDPRMGSEVLIHDALVSSGIWEITPGTVVDTEVDELFVVLSGAARVEFDDGTAPMVLGPGSVGRLVAGTRTRWTITQTLRKVYVVLGSDG